MFESNSLRNISGSRFWCHTNLPITLKTAQAALFQLMLIHAKRSKDSLLFPGLNKTIKIHFQFIWFTSRKVMLEEVKKIKAFTKHITEMEKRYQSFRNKLIMVDYVDQLFY